MQHTFGKSWTLFLMAAVILASCRQQDSSQTVTVKNNLNLDRTAETVSIPVERVAEMVQKYGAEHLLVRDAATDSLLVTQALDNDGDGTADEILFQTDIAANAEKGFTIAGAEDAAQQPRSKYTTFSRQVPERVDDYAWENDRVGFRTYGPEGQRRTEAGEPGGAMGSGLDLWLKRVPYLVLDKWYKMEQEGKGSYHEDTGEGYDPYQVGASRGTGGTGVWANNSLYVSKNYASFKKLADGPIRTVFELTYAPFQADGHTVHEKKRISLDLGSNLTRVEDVMASDEPLPNITVGITLHDKQGEVQAAKEQGWFRYWEPMDSASLGTGIVLAPAAVQAYKDRRVSTPDQSHLLVITKPENGKITYYAGFGWTRSGQFRSKAEWDEYLANFARRIASPLEVTF